MSRGDGVRDLGNHQLQLGRVPVIARDVDLEQVKSIRRGRVVAVEDHCLAGRSRTPETKRSGFTPVLKID
jgi:hypothetical protein